MASLSPFAIINSICEGTRGVDLFASVRHGEIADGSESPEKAYVGFMINRGLSYHADTVLLANEMNRRHRTPAVMQYDFLRGTIRARKRFAKWEKMEDSDAVKFVSLEYGYSYPKAREALKLLDEDQIETIIKKHDHGGLVTSARKAAKTIAKKKASKNADDSDTSD